MITALAATKAYGAAQKSMGVDPGLGGASIAPGGGFGDILKSAMTDVMKSTKNAETQMAAQVHGKAELVDVVTAISAAESSLETVMAIRDQVINAYQEIMRMPI
ncbi:MAG: flagellar hook-basal body complex protein FliE [Phenylobacterium sp.]